MLERKCQTVAFKSSQRNVNTLKASMGRENQAITSWGFLGTGDEPWRKAWPVASTRASTQFFQNHVLEVRPELSQQGGWELSEPFAASFLFFFILRKKTQNPKKLTQENQKQRRMEMNRSSVKILQ